jgi:hypothetical protein
MKSAGAQQRWSCSWRRRWPSMASPGHDPSTVIQPTGRRRRTSGPAVAAEIRSRRRDPERTRLISLATRSHAQLAAEILFLRKQLALYA